MSIQEGIENGFTKINEEIAVLKCELKDDIKSTRKEFEALRVRIVKQDYSRRENLRFYYILESAQETNEDCFEKVKQDLSDLGALS